MRSCLSSKCSMTGSALDNGVLGAPYVPERFMLIYYEVGERNKLELIYIYISIIFKYKALGKLQINWSLAECAIIG